MIALLFGFSFGLAACNGEEDVVDDEALLEEAVDALAIYSTDMNDIRGSFRVPLQGRNGTTITWEVTPDSVAEMGATYEGDMDEQLVSITPPEYGEGSVDITLTATITLNDAETTQSFDGVVKELPEGTTAYGSFAELYDNAEVGDTVIVSGIVVHTVGDSYFIWDGEETLSVFRGGDVELGDQVELRAEYASYHSLYQLSSPDEETVISSGHDHSVSDIGVVESSVEEFLEIDSDNKGIHGMPHRVEGMIVEGDLAGTGYTNYYIQDTNDPDQFILMYHAQNAGSLDWLGDHEGEIVDITISLYAEHSSDGHIAFFDENNFEYEVLDIDEEAMLNVGIQEIENRSFTTSGDDVNLPSESGNGTEFSNWTSSNPDLMSNEGEFVNQPEENTSVTFTGDADFTFDGETATGEASLEVTVIGTETMSVTNSLSQDEGEFVHIEGNVTSFPVFSGDNGYFIQDEDGTAIRIMDDHDVILGNKVSVAGYLEYHTQYQADNTVYRIQDAHLTSNDDKSNDVTVISDESIEDVANDFQNNQAKRFYFEDVEVDYVSEDHNYVMLNTGADKGIRYDIRNYGPELGEVHFSAGETIEWVEVTLSHISHGNIEAEYVEGPNFETVSQSIYDPDTISDVIETDEGDFVFTEGIVTSYPVFSGSDGFFIQDESGHSIKIADNHQVEIGNKITIRGELNYRTDNQDGNNVYEIIESDLITNDDKSNDVTIINDESIEDVANDFQNNQAKRFYFEDVEVDYVSEDHNYVMLNTDADKGIRYDIRNYGPELGEVHFSAGETIEWVEVTLSHISYENIVAEYVEGLSFVELDNKIE